MLMHINSRKMIILNSCEFGSANLEAIDDFENSNQVQFPEDYKKFLIEHNGGRPEPNIIVAGSFKTDVQAFLGMHDGPFHANLWQHMQVFQNRIPGWYLPIATDSGGNLFIMSLWKDNNGFI